MALVEAVYILFLFKTRKIGNLCFWGQKSGEKRQKTCDFICKWNEKENEEMCRTVSIPPLLYPIRWGRHPYLWCQFICTPGKEYDLSAPSVCGIYAFCLGERSSLVFVSMYISLLFIQTKQHSNNYNYVQQTLLI